MSKNRKVLGPTGKILDDEWYRRSLANLTRITHRPPSQGLDEADWRVARRFEPRDKRGDRFLLETRLLTWGRPLNQGEEADESTDLSDAVPWRYPTTAERRLGEQGKAVLIRLLFDEWRGSGRPRIWRNRAAARRDIQDNRSALLARVQALYRQTADDPAARLQQLAPLAQAFGIGPEHRPKLSQLIGQPPSRATDQLLAWKWRLRRAEVLPLAKRTSSD